MNTTTTHAIKRTITAKKHQAVSAVTTTSYAPKKTRKITQGACEVEAQKPRESAKARLDYNVRTAWNTRFFEQSRRINPVEITTVKHNWALNDMLIPPNAPQAKWKCQPYRAVYIDGHIAVLLRGRSFLRGPSQPYMIGFNVEAQIEATKSQIDSLILPLQEAGYAVDVFSATYTTEFTDELMALFGKLLRSDIRSNWKILNTPVAEAENSFEVLASVAVYAQRHNVTYQTVTIIQHDIYFKQDVASFVLQCKNFCVPFASSEFDSAAFNASGLVWQTMHGGLLGCLLDDLNRPIRQLSWASVVRGDFMNRMGGKVEHLMFSKRVAATSYEVKNPFYITVGQCVERAPSSYRNVSRNNPVKTDLIHWVRSSRGTFMCEPNTSEKKTVTAANERIAVVLSGMSFRSARIYQGNRQIGFDPDLQMAATQSVLDLLIQPLETLGHRVDVFSGTYTTAFSYMIMEKLANYLRADIRTSWAFLSGHAGQSVAMLQAILSAVQYARRHNVVYRTMTILRHDLQLKQDVAPLVLACNQFCAPFQQSGYQSGKHWPFGGKSRVPDTWQTMPWKFVGCLLVALQNQRGFWPFEMIGRVVAPLIGEDKIGFLKSDIRGDSDPFKQPNPLYRFCARPERSR